MNNPAPALAASGKPAKADKPGPKHDKPGSKKPQAALHPLQTYAGTVAGAGRAAHRYRCPRPTRGDVAELLRDPKGHLCGLGLTGQASKLRRPG